MAKLTLQDEASMPGFNAARVEMAIRKINPKTEFEEGSEMWFHCVFKCGPCATKIGTCVSTCWRKTGFFPCVVNCLGMKGAEHCVQCIECFATG